MVLWDILSNKIKFNVKLNESFPPQTPFSDFPISFYLSFETKFLQHCEPLIGLCPHFSHRLLWDLVQCFPSSLSSGCSSHISALSKGRTQPYGLSHYTLHNTAPPLLVNNQQRAFLASCLILEDIYLPGDTIMFSGQMKAHFAMSLRPKLPLKLSILSLPLIPSFLALFPPQSNCV